MQVPMHTIFKHWVRKLLFTLAMILFSGCASASITPAHAEGPKEYVVKAAILYKFIQFVEWPSTGGPMTDINVCLIGTDPFGSVLSIIEKQKLNNTAVHVVRNVPDSKVSACHVLFISTSEEYRASKILSMVQGKPILTVSEIDGFITKGGMIGFMMSDNKVKFEINNVSARKANLRIDAQVLELALNVIDK